MEGEVLRISSYKELEVWKRSMDLVEIIYKITQQFPQSEMYGMVSQLKRASVSVPSNIAEGASRQSTKEFIQFLNLANGSLSEIETLLELAIRLNYLENNNLQPHINHIRSMIFGLIKALRKKL
ncbi:MAG TPA: four helix bundle protein [Bacteroidales bacterium]|nr:four helix bundle protein [Bacteroidales bacterium]